MPVLAMVVELFEMWILDAEVQRWRGHDAAMMLEFLRSRRWSLHDPALSGLKLKGFLERGHE